MGPSQVWTESPVISVSNCGENPLVIDRIALLPGTDAFELSNETLPNFPSTLDAGAEPLSFRVNYGPPTPACIVAKWRYSPMIRISPPFT